MKTKQMIILQIRSNSEILGIFKTEKSMHEWISNNYSLMINSNSFMWNTITMEI